MNTSSSWYDILGITPNASPDEIAAAWHTTAKATHPDRGGDPAAFDLAQQAWEVLGDPHHRAAYDATLTTPDPIPQPENTEAPTHDTHLTRIAYNDPHIHIRSRAAVVAGQIMFVAASAGVALTVGRWVRSVGHSSMSVLALWGSGWVLITIAVSVAAIVARSAARPLLAMVGWAVVGIAAGAGHVGLQLLLGSLVIAWALALWWLRARGGPRWSPGDIMAGNIIGDPGRAEVTTVMEAVVVAIPAARAFWRPDGSAVIVCDRRAATLDGAALGWVPGARTRHWQTAGHSPDEVIDQISAWLLEHADGLHIDAVVLAAVWQRAQS